MARGIKGAKKKMKQGSHTRQDASSSRPPICTKVWRPGVDKLEEGEELQYDPSAYNCLHSFDIGWPCLSFDILRDTLGLVRTEFPHTIYAVAGTQAKKSTWNYIGIFKLSNITGKRRSLLPKSSVDDDIDSESDNSSNEDDVDDENGSSSPVLTLQRIAHRSCVNRIRAMPQNERICASWAEKGCVQIWDLHAPLANLEMNVNKGSHAIQNISPIIKFDGHSTEGFALAWNPLSLGTLVSGDCSGRIHLWEPSSGTWNVATTSFEWHFGSVEDLQWSPENPNVFASCSTDKNIALWDTRMRKSPVLFFQAHESDVNVISWNSIKEPKQLASGSDDGSLSIHDVRVTEKGLMDFLHRVKYHQHPITSIEWNPNNETGLAVSSSDNQLSIWDFSVERDQEQEGMLKSCMKDQVDYVDDLPAHLLFVHQGQKDIKELHWHPRIEGMLLSTAADGFNVLMPTNICQCDC